MSRRPGDPLIGNCNECNSEVELAETANSLGVCQRCLPKEFKKSDKIDLSGFDESYFREEIKKELKKVFNYNNPKNVDELRECFFIYLDAKQYTESRKILLIKFLNEGLSDYNEDNFSEQRAS